MPSALTKFEDIFVRVTILTLFKHVTISLMNLYTKANVTDLHRTLDGYVISDVEGNRNKITA